ncbi:transcriptional regulator, partial [Bacillus cereus]
MVNTKTKLKRATFKYIESELYGYRDTLREIAFLRKNLIYGSRNEDGNIGGGRTNRRNHPTERIATACMMNKKLARLEELADAIEHIYQRVEPDKQKLIRLKYWTRPQLQTW